MSELVYQRDSKKPIYVSTQIFRMLYLLAKSEGPTGRGECTGDEIADQILRQAIREQHPQLLEHLSEIEKLEKQLIKKLQNEKRNDTDGAAPVEGGAATGAKAKPI